MAQQAGNDQINPTSLRFRDFVSRNPATQAQLAHHSISRGHLTRLDQPSDDNNILTATPSNENAGLPLLNMRCCCGRADCAYLEHNDASLRGLEKDLETAARLGKALLDRHEAYVKESQAEQARLSSQVTELEHEKANLQQANHMMIVENRELLQKLEQLNTDLGNSSKRVHELEELLHTCEEDLRRFNGLTRKTQELEMHVADIEKEHAQLVLDLDDQKLETRSIMTRWKDSERKVRELEQEVKKIELAARLDREKHEDAIIQLHRDRALEREMGLSEGRLKATAAIQSMQKGGVQKQVVSNFVRDILQDNANLQTGIAELKELLQTSNDEVQMLREQILLHQPLEENTAPTPQRTLSLGDELGLSQPMPEKQPQQELHVHHHYHTKVGGKKEKSVARKTPRKRAQMYTGLSSPSPSASGRSTPLLRPQRLASSPAVPLSVQPVRSNRWSIQSTASATTYVSSIASSPTSWHDRTSSIFDRIDRGEESSRPTSPESFNIASPLPFKRRDRNDDTALPVFEEEDVGLEECVSPTHMRTSEDLDHPEEAHVHDEDTLMPETDLTPKPSMMLREEGQIQGRDNTETDGPPEPDPPPDANTTGRLETDDHAEPQMERSDDLNLGSHLTEEKNDQGVADAASSIDIRPSRGRSNSHDSLFSLSGMDLHLPQQSSRSTLALLHGHGANKHHFAPLPAAIRQAPTSTSQPLAAITEYTAISKAGVENTISPSMQALSGLRCQTTPGLTAQAPSRGLMGSVGGWVTSRWKAPSTMKSVADLRSAAAGSSVSSRPRPAPTKLASSSTASGAGVAASTTSMSSVSNGQRSVSANALPVHPHKITDQSSQATTLSSSFLGRASGINQSGPIPGFAAALAAKTTPTIVNPNTVDLTGLKESLAEQ